MFVGSPHPQEPKARLATCPHGEAEACLFFSIALIWFEARIVGKHFAAVILQPAQPVWRRSSGAQPSTIRLAAQVPVSIADSSHGIPM